MMREVFIKVVAKKKNRIGIKKMHPEVILPKLKQKPLMEWELIGE